MNKTTIKLNALDWCVENALLLADLTDDLRFPTHDELVKLSGLIHCWDDEKKGMWFAEKEDDLKNPEKSLFFPAAGLRDSEDGKLKFYGRAGFYLSSNRTEDGKVYILYFTSDNVVGISWMNPAHGLSIRNIKM